MGVLNVSPESFHAGSVHAAADDLLSTALAMVEAGAGGLKYSRRILWIWSKCSMLRT